MKWYNIDQHVAVISDVTDILSRYGHTVYSQNLSGHTPIVLRQPQAHMRMLDGDAWCTTMNQRKFKEFHERYSREWEEYDGFICCYPPIFSWLYQYTDKPIIIVIPIRYENGADCDAPLWEEFNEYLRTGVDSGRIHLVANNRYDQHYAECFLQRPVAYIPSLCAYTKAQYMPMSEHLLYYASFEYNDPNKRILRKHNMLSAGHSWQDVASFKASVWFPYNVSIMSIFEQYTANVPMFFPTQRYLLDLYEEGKVLQQIAWRRTNSASPGSIIKGDFSAHHWLDPNQFDDLKSVQHWLKYCDWYQEDTLGGVLLFDSEEELQALVLSTDYAKVSEDMAERNVARKKHILFNWEDLLGKIEKGVARA